MTCDIVRERLLHESTEAFEALEPHLNACPACAALAAAVVRTEDALRTHLEDHMTRLDLDTRWDAAAAAVPQRNNRWLHGALIGLAAAAVLVVTVWSGGPFSADPVPDPEGQRSAASLVLGDALDAVDAFDAIEVAPFDEGMDRDEQDAFLLALLRDKATALTEAEAALADAAEDTDSTVRTAALLELGELYLRMGIALIDLPRPTYLNESQSELYGMAMEDKASAQWLKAVSTLELGLSVAEENGLEAEVAWLDDALADAADLLLSLEPTPEDHPPEADLTAAARRYLDALPARVEDIERTLDQHADCLSPDSMEEIGMILKQAHQVIEAQDGFVAGDVHQLLGAYGPALDQAVADCDAPPVSKLVVDDESVRQPIEGYAGRLQHCFEDAPIQQTGTTIELSWMLDSGVVVGTPQVRTDTNGAVADTLTQCLQQEVLRWSFPVDSGGKVVFTRELRRR